MYEISLAAGASFAVLCTVMNSGAMMKVAFNEYLFEGKRDCLNM